MKQEGRYWRLYIYSYTARAVAQLLYGGCSIALERKLSKAQKMFDPIEGYWGKVIDYKNKTTESQINEILKRLGRYPS